MKVCCTWLVYSDSKRMPYLHPINGNKVIAFLVNGSIMYFTFLVPFVNCMYTIQIVFVFFQLFNIFTYSTLGFMLGYDIHSLLTCAGHG